MHLSSHTNIVIMPRFMMNYCQITFSVACNDSVCFSKSCKVYLSIRAVHEPECQWSLLLGIFFILIAFVKVPLVLFMIDLFCRASHYIIVIVSISGDHFESQIKIEV